MLQKQPGNSCSAKSSPPEACGTWLTALRNRHAAVQQLAGVAQVAVDSLAAFFPAETNIGMRVIAVEHGD
jgi:hypothetical protein